MDTLSASPIDRVFQIASRADRAGVTVTRLGLIVVLLWIGGLKAFPYEADGIVPFVANSPFMSFLLAHDAPAYKQYMNAEGVLLPENRSWHESNRTYSFAYALGAVIVVYGLMLCLHPWLPQVAALGSFLVFVMSFVTLSFLVTTPETWVPALGDAHHGFPYLSGRGRLVVKDAIMMGAALVTMADSAKAYLGKQSSRNHLAADTSQRARRVSARWVWVRHHGNQHFGLLSGAVHQAPSQGQ
jgi:reactive chlorine resistance protein C